MLDGCRFFTSSLHAHTWVSGLSWLPKQRFKRCTSMVHMARWSKKSQHVEQKMLGCDIYSERSQFLVVCRNGHRQCRSYVTDINLVVSGLSTGSWWGLPLANIWVMAALGSFPVSVSKICAFWYSNVFARYLDDDIVWIRVRASMVLYEWNETTLLATSRRLQLTWVAWSKHSRATASI